MVPLAARVPREEPTDPDTTEPPELTTVDERSTGGLLAGYARTLLTELRRRGVIRSTTPQPATTGSG